MTQPEKPSVLPSLPLAVPPAGLRPQGVSLAAIFSLALGFASMLASPVFWVLWPVAVAATGLGIWGLQQSLCRGRGGAVMSALGIACALAGAVLWISGIGARAMDAMFGYCPRDGGAAMTRVRMEAMGTALQDYYITQQEYPFQTDPPTQQAKPLAAAADKLVAKGHLSRKKADDHKLDGWSRPMLYLLYNYRQAPYPQVTYVSVDGLPPGDWSGRVNSLMARNVLDWQSAHPILGSAGADGVFGTDDDIYNDRSM